MSDLNVNLSESTTTSEVVALVLVKYININNYDTTATSENINLALTQNTSVYDTTKTSESIGILITTKLQTLSQDFIVSSENVNVIQEDNINTFDTIVSSENVNVSSGMPEPYAPLVYTIVKVGNPKFSIVRANLPGIGSSPAAVYIFGLGTFGQSNNDFGIST